MREANKLSICDGKYTIVQEPDGHTKVLRYGDEWRDVTGDNVIGGLAYELTAANERIKRLEEALSPFAQITDIANDADCTVWKRNVTAQSVRVARSVLLGSKEATP